MDHPKPPTYFTTTSPPSAPVTIPSAVAVSEVDQARAQLEAANPGAIKPPVYYYNLGTLDLKQGKLEMAWINFGMAKVKSQDPAVEKALYRVENALFNNGKSASDLDPTSDSFLKIGEVVPLTSLTLASSGLLLISVILVVTSWMRGKARAAHWWFSGICFFITSSLLILSFWVSSFHPAWVTKEEIARTGPGTNYLEVGKIPIGTKLRLVRKEKGWIRVRLNRNGSEGYLPKSSLLLWESE